MTYPVGTLLVLKNRPTGRIIYITVRANEDELSSSNTWYFLYPSNSWWHQRALDDYFDVLKIPE